ncbi:GPW/gp25 family protein [Aeromonas sp. SG16]|uniref:GPW/gp25 family protein n=1 Tax=Aeromonas sp. SG16 TaxID=2950548 RepID=UPI00210DDA42|nr:GPW/gp25 family protein [Aeromonas sp. SG16]MCQ4054443.1 GPW/gp25 family protein [Aeromonas sp. SG16]
MSNELADLYGRGWSFPPTFTEQGVVMAEGMDDIFQSLNILFCTQFGDRILHEEFGCDLNQFVFSNITNTLLSDIERQINDCVLRYEPRVEIVDVRFDTLNMQSGILTIEVNYRLCGSDIFHQFSKRINMIDGVVG